MTEKKLALDRLVFFSDAVVAIAITLLALDLHIGKTADGHLHFSDIFSQWQKFVAFLLSFLIIAIFWKIHHQMFYYIRQINQLVLWANLGWLLFIVLLPFSASLVSSYLSDVPAILLYSVNVLCITIFQNMLWDHVALHKEMLVENAPEKVIRNFRLNCNVAMINALLAVGICFFSPLAAFIVLFTRLPMMGLVRILFRRSKD